MKDDLMGQRFGRLLVIGEAGIAKGGDAKWLCRCDCGNESIVWAKSLKHGTTQSCGCLASELSRERLEKHGLSYTSEYRTWKLMHQRCLNPNYLAYPNYGGRGIKICGRWLNDPQAFCTDMGPKPSPYYTIERIDNDGDYSPENCRWATRHEQEYNKRTSHLITFQGRTQCLAQWAAELGMQRSTLRHRLINSGWSIEKALTTPLAARR